MNNYLNFTPHKARQFSHPSSISRDQPCIIHTVNMSWCVYPLISTEDCKPAFANFTTEMDWIMQKRSLVTHVRAEKLKGRLLIFSLKKKQHSTRSHFEVSSPTIMSMHVQLCLMGAIANNSLSRKGRLMYQHLTSQHYRNAHTSALGRWPQYLSFTPLLQLCLPH